MRLADLIGVSERVRGTRSRREKVEALAGFLRGLAPGEVEVAVRFLTGNLRQGRIGLGPAAVREGVARSAAAGDASIEILEVDRGFEAISRIAGKGSGGERVRALGAFLGRATEAERQFLVRLILGELRQGALEGVMAAAIARATGASEDDVRRAEMLSGDLAGVARAALVEGPAALGRFSIRLFRPVLPMLAGTAESIEDVFARMEEAILEDKLDGARVQAHRGGGEVRVYSRRLNDVTGSVPEVVEAVRAMPGSDLILDGEAIALDAAGRPLPFQTTMRRFGRQLDVERMRRELPLSVRWFDCLHAAGASLLDQPTTERRRAAVEAAGEAAVVRSLATASPGSAARFLESALAAGHEGVMAKDPAAPYEAGHRGGAWLKLKSVPTLDLVVLAAEWGSGRRSGWLSNLHLGARDPATGGFVMVGKTFKGMTDEVLAWQTGRLQQIAVECEGHVVRVRPELVVEIAIGGVQASPRYPGGLALRFARLRGYRPEKRPEDADTIDTVRALRS